MRIWIRLPKTRRMRIRDTGKTMWFSLESIEAKQTQVRKTHFHDLYNLSWPLQNLLTAWTSTLTASRSTQTASTYTLAVLQAFSINTRSTGTVLSCRSACYVFCATRPHLLHISLCEPVPITPALCGFSNVVCETIKYPYYLP
jgi:hypothetical protein